MDRDACVDILNRVLHGTANSVVQYIGIADPYVPPGHEEQLETIARLGDEEAQTAHDINEMLAELDGTPQVGVFDYWNLDLNYLDLRYLARFAAQHQEKVVAELEAELDLTRDLPKVYGLLQRVLELKRAHLATLREIAGPDEPARPDAAES